MVGLKSKSLRIDFEGLYNTFLGLTPREQTLTLVGIGVALLLVIGLPISFASSRLSSFEDSIAKGEEKRKEVVREIAHYQDLTQRLQLLEQEYKTGYDSTLTTTMEKLAENSGIKERIESLKEGTSSPSDYFDEFSVDVHLSKVTLPQLVDYLYRIEHHDRLMLRLNQIQIKPRYDNKQLLDVSFRVSTYRLQEGA